MTVYVKFWKQIQDKRKPAEISSNKKKTENYSKVCKTTLLPISIIILPIIMSLKMPENKQK